MTKIGLVLEGGGMKCAYGAGVIDCLLEGDIRFDYCIGVSAGSANGACYVSGQHGRAKRFYTDHPKDPEYFGLKAIINEKGLFGLDYIYQTISSDGGKDPFDYDSFMSSSCDYEAVVTNAATGRAVYLPKSAIRRNDYRAIMASSCLPVLCRPVMFEGEYYFDGGVSDSIPCDRAFAMGCDKIVVILSKPRNFVKEPEGHKTAYTHALKDYPAMIEAMDRRHLMYRENQRRMYSYEAAGKAFIFAISRPARLSTYNMDVKISEDLYNLGRRDYAANAAKLRAFLGA